MKPKPNQEQNTPSVVQDGGAAAASGFSMGKSLFADKPESLYQVKRIRCGNVNCWLVSGSKALPTNGSVLVDTGRKEDFPKLEQLCREKKLPLYLTEGANHSMETGDVLKDLETMKQIMEQCEAYLSGI